MKFIYIKNYLDLSGKEKLNFLNFANSVTGLKVSEQKVIFDENSLLLGIEDTTKIRVKL